MFGPCSRLDCKQQTLCFVVLCKTRTQAWKGNGSSDRKPDTRVLNDWQQHLHPQTVFKDIHSSLQFPMKQSASLQAFCP